MSLLIKLSKQHEVLLEADGEGEEELEVLVERLDLRSSTTTILYIQWQKLCSHSQSTIWP